MSSVGVEGWKKRDGRSWNEGGRKGPQAIIIVNECLGGILETRRNGEGKKKSKRERER